MAWGNTTGGDHEGAAWTPANTTVIGGVHYNISTFTVTTGYTLHLEDDNELEIYGDTITVTGDIDGNGHSTAGCGNGGGGGNDNSGAGGGGGGGYGGAGGAGHAGAYGAGGVGGSQCGSTDTTIIYMGGRGGYGGLNSTRQGSGGKGGGSVYLSGNTVTVTGTISVNGLNGGSTDTSGGGGGGGSGGGLLIVGGAVTFSGAYSGTGGNGGNATGSDDDGAGGGGGGGRAKIIGRTINVAGATWTLTAGTAGTGYGGAATNGTAGNHTETEVKCNSTYAMGQTFTPDTAITGKFYLSEIRLWVMTVTTSGKVFTMTVYDDSAKGTNYGNATLTISSTGEKVFAFEPWIELPDAHDQYYLEVTTPDGDVDFGTEGNEPLTGEDMYFKVVLVERFSMYVRVFGLIPVDSPTVYNIADTTVKSEVSNYMLAGAIHTIDTDGTGTFQYSDDFTTAKYGQDAVTAGTVTYDSSNNEVDIAESSSMYWKCDTKHPPTGIPTLEARLNVTGGVPTVKIAADSGGSPDTWYDIDTAIVDDVLTVYDLDNAANISIKKTGTPFYVKIDCPAGATVSVKSIQIDADLVTIDVEHPIISHDGVSTFRCDQNAGSGMSCVIELGYRARSWPA